VTTGPRYWVWATRPEAYPDLDLPEATWCCSPATRTGDLGVVYRSRERKDVSHLVAVRSDAAPDDGRRPVCQVRIAARFPEPLPLARMRADPVLRDWPALRAGFVQRCFPVPAAVWTRLCELLAIGAPDTTNGTPVG
jgi:predicted RNA-binding protein with PUA-like domain